MSPDLLGHILIRTGWLSHYRMPSTPPRISHSKQTRPVIVLQRLRIPQSRPRPQKLSPLSARPAAECQDSLQCKLQPRTLQNGYLPCSAHICAPSCLFPQPYRPSHSSQAGPQDRPLFCLMLLIATEISLPRCDSVGEKLTPLLAVPNHTSPSHKGNLVCLAKCGAD